MAFLFATSFYLFTILFYSISHRLSIGAEGLSPGWSYGSHAGFEGFKVAVPSFGEVCNRFNFIRSQKLICLLCKGLHPSCLLPSTTTQPSTTTTSTTTAATTTAATTTAATTTSSTSTSTTPTTTTTTTEPSIEE